MPQILRTWSLVLGKSYRPNIWTQLKTYLSDLETRTCERKGLGQKQGCLVSSGVNLSSRFRWWRTLGHKSTYAKSLLPAYLTTLKPATLFQGQQVTFRHIRFPNLSSFKSSLCHLTHLQTVYGQTFHAVIEWRFPMRTLAVRSPTWSKVFRSLTWFYEDSVP